MVKLINGQIGRIDWVNYTKNTVVQEHGHGLSNHILVERNKKILVKRNIYLVKLTTGAKFKWKVNILLVNFNRDFLVNIYPRRF